MEIIISGEDLTLEVNHHDSSSITIDIWNYNEQQVDLSFLALAISGSTERILDKVKIILHNHSNLNSDVEDLAIKNLALYVYGLDFSSNIRIENLYIKSYTPSVSFAREIIVNNLQIESLSSIDIYFNQR